MKSPDRLYELLPVVYRQRDVERGEPLRALLRVIAEQVDVVERDIDRLYENWFIETCEDWVVPYLGDLIGYRPVHDAGEPGDPRLERARARNRVLIPRREMANTIRFRRRKGALALLELLANDVAGWPARAVEFYTRLGWTQDLDHQRPRRGRTVDLRRGAPLDLLDGPFDSSAHTVDVRAIDSPRTPGRSNIPSVGVFVWRLRAYSVGRPIAPPEAPASLASATPAACIEAEAPHCYTLSVLGNDTPLYTRPERETDPTHIAGELNVPAPIRRYAFEHRSGSDRPSASEAYYGREKSLAIWAPNWPRKGAPQPIPAAAIVPANLHGWRYHAPRDHIAVDPETGRIVFPATQLPKQGVRVSYHYGFSADVGGGQYDRPLAEPPDAKLYRVAQSGSGGPGAFDTIKAALEQWARDKAAGGAPPRSAVIEIVDNAVYTDPLGVQLEENESLQIRAANRARPVVRLLDYLADLPDALRIRGDRGSRLTLDGLLITGRSVTVAGPDVDPDAGDAEPAGDLCSVTVRHCTLVPGWGLHCDCEPKRSTEPSLVLHNTSARLTIEHSIVGAIEVVADARMQAPVRIDLSDSVLDATRGEREVLSGPDCAPAYAVVSVVRSTVIGRVVTHAIALAENSIFTGRVRVARRQTGCMRFCYVPPDSRTPRRYECQPDLVEQLVTERYVRHEISATERDALWASERLRVRPQFNSTRYGTPTYCQLAQSCAPEITGGADDEAEMGVFHDLYQPQRAANLRARLDEHTPAGMHAGVIYVT